MAAVQLAAVLFCDGVGSTELLVRLGDREFGARRQRFDAVVRGAIGRHRGRVVKNLGDGAMAAFEAATDVLAAGVAIQQAVRRESEGSPDDTFSARVGISAGEVSAEEDDLFGTTVVEASRLCAAAAPGQVLASASAAVLARNGPTPLRGVPPLVLKGFPEPVEGFEVDWTDVADPGPVTGAALPAPLRSVSAFRFVARRPEWERLEQAWATVRDGGRHAVLVRGAPGAGKTRLATEFARRVAADGATVLFGACREGGGPPFEPVVDAIEHLLAHADDLGIDAASAERARSLLQTEHDEEEAGLACTFSPGPRAARFEVATDLLVAAGRHAPVLFVLDDLQWAGRPTLQLVLHWLRSPAPLRCCLVATHRETRSDISDTFDDALAEFHRLEGMTRLQVSGLDTEGVEAFVEAVAEVPLDAVPARAVAVLSQQTDGNPFLLGELWRQFVETGALVREGSGWVARPALESLASPDSVRSVVGRRIDRLPSAARELLEIAAVAGPTFPVELLAAITDTDGGSVLELLEPAIASATIEELVPGSFRFAHAIVWRAIYDRLTTARRVSWHLRVAQEIERREVSNRSLSDLARHYAAAVPVAEAATAIAVAERAADVAIRALAYEDAVELLARVLPLESSPGRRATLMVRIAEAELPAGDAESAISHVREAIVIARALDRGELLVRAALVFEEATWRLGLPGDEAERLIREVLPRVTDETTRIHVLAARGRALALSGDPAAGDVIESAIAAARRLGDQKLLRFALGTWFNLIWDPERYDLMLERAYELRAMCVGVDDHSMAAHTQQWFVVALLLNAEFADLREAVAEHQRLCERSQEPFFKHYLTAALRSTVAVMDGRLDDAEALAREANDFAEGLSGVDVSGAFGVQMFSLRREQGRLDEIRPVVEAVVRLDRAHAAWRPGLTAVYAELGMLEEARAELQLLVTPGLERIPRDALYLGALTYLADAIAIVGDRFLATTLYAALEPYRNTVAVVGHLIACYGAVDRYLGALAETVGRSRDAERHYVRAIEIDSEADAPTWLAHSRFRYARFLARQGRRDGPPRALALLDDVVEAARTIGMPVLEQRAATLAAELRSDVGSEPEPPRATRENGAFTSLTPRERQILDCLVDGLSNAAIGGTLHISTNTAANHVRAILLKTGCANRTEAATWAVRNGIVAR